MGFLLFRLCVVASTKPLIASQDSAETADHPKPHLFSRACRDLGRNDTHFPTVIISLDKIQRLGEDYTKWIGQSQSASGLGENRGLSLLWEYLLPVALNRSVWACAKFVCNDIIGTIGLSGTQILSADWLRD